MTFEDDLAGSFSQLKQRARAMNYEHYPAKFVAQSMEILKHVLDSRIQESMAHAALFDLAVTAAYLERVATSGWYYCTNHDRRYLVYPFVNACPICTIEGDIKFVKAKKPQSAQIGATTSMILAAFLDLKAKANLGPEAEIYKLNDTGHVDAYLKFRDQLVLFEIKSAPLIAYPLISPIHKMTEFDSVTTELKEKTTHSESDASANDECFLLIDEELRIPVGNPFDFAEKKHYALISNWLRDEENMIRYVMAWNTIFNSYANRDHRRNTYWLTNGCGAPSPPPTDWPRRRTSGYESISDGKSSMGMDRTDDLKKGIYQVLKISTHFKEFFPHSDFSVFSAIASNIHAVKHEKDYIDELKDIVWTIDSDEKPYVSPHMDGTYSVKEGKLYNLFDAIVTFTSSHFRDDFLKEAFDYND